MTWKNRERLTRCPYRDHRKAMKAATSVPATAPPMMSSAPTLEEQRVHQQRRFHALAGHHQQREPEDAQERPAPDAGRGRLEAGLDVPLHPLAGAPHVHRQRGDENPRDQREQPFPQRLVTGAREENSRQDAQRHRRRNPPVDGGNERTPAALLQIGEADRDNQEGLETFAEGYDKCLEHGESPSKLRSSLKKRIQGYPTSQVGYL